MTEQAHALKIVFMGTPEFGAVVLRRLATSPYQVVGVVTQPDRPVGRKNLLTPPAVKVTAQEFNLPVMQAAKLRDPAVLAQLHQFSREADVFVVASFGMLLPTAVLQMPRLGCLNVHGSLLPAYRGASPVAQAILDGKRETGVTIMLMEKGLDTGPMLSRQAMTIAPGETQAGLMSKLAEVGAALLLETLPAWAAGGIEPQPQDPTQATLTGIISKDAGRIDWAKSAVYIERMTRAYDPWPGAFTYWAGQLLKILRADVFNQDQLTLVEPNVSAPEPGWIGIAQIGSDPKAQRLVVATGEGWLAPRELQLAGKKALASRDFLTGQRQLINAILG